ncbi:MAG: ABC transporter permease subunit [Calditrichaeota bacterium]|mgnify:CR=1 FL=1|jgi:ABC-2 type transport system permease protein|nr:ABC transporter permease subunit [Calditrichota bacterium]MBT7787309.1 ABC transporter permease subunit [Calditrichota bacterium]
MRNIWAIFKRELRAYFDSPTAYVVIIVFLLITGWFFTTNFFLVAQADMRVAFGIIPFVFIFITPAITMRLISEERKAGTIELLVTMPITDAEVIVGKYLAALALLISMLIPTIVYTVIVAILGDIDMGPVIGGYMGLALMGAGYLAIGTFGSSMTENQVVAYITSWLMVFAFFLMDKMLFILPNWLVTPVEYLSIEYHFQNISRGVIDSRDLIYYLSLVVLTLMLASRSLAARRWR